MQVKKERKERSTNQAQTVFVANLKQFHLVPKDQPKHLAKAIPASTQIMYLLTHKGRVQRSWMMVKVAMVECPS